MTTQSPRAALAVFALLMPAFAAAQLTIESRESELEFDGTNFGNTDEFAISLSLSAPFDETFGGTLMHEVPGGGTNEGSYSTSQQDAVSATVLETTHVADCDITLAGGSPVMRITGAFEVEFSVADPTVITLDGALSGSSNVAQDPFTSTVLEVASQVGTPDVFNSLLDSFPLIEELQPGNTYRLRVNERTTCNIQNPTKSASAQVRLEVVPDSDDDGLLNIDDNCVFVPNPDQTDSNGDGIGNACDADLNGDCSVNFADLADLKSAFFPNPYNADADFNGDGGVNFGDLAVMKATFFIGGDPGPGPSGLPNDCD